MSKNSGSDFSKFSMLDLFRVEVETQAAVLTNGLLTLEQEPHRRKDIEAMMRAAHSMKGAARIVRIQPAVDVAHAMEDCLVEVQNNRLDVNEELIDLLFQGVDVMTRLSTVYESKLQIWIDGHISEINNLISNLRFICAQNDVDNSSQHSQQNEESHLGVSTSADNALGSITKFEGYDHSTDQSLRVVRISADRLDRLMNFSSGFVVQSKWYKPFLLELQRQRRGLRDLEGLLDHLKTEMASQPLNESLLLWTDELDRRLEKSQKSFDRRLEDFERYSLESSQLASRLYHEVIQTRMRPFSDGVSGFPRMVRDISRKLGKQVDLQISGLQTEVDRDILDRLEAPLTHLLRNAIDHGIESPEERIAAGKPEKGIIRLEAIHQAGLLCITIADDGRGIDLDRLRRKVIERQNIKLEIAGKMSVQELMEFLFLPGFTTSNHVTEISGRGIGLDIVHRMVQMVGGIVRASSEPGKGIHFLLQLPLTRSVVRALIIEISGEPYAIPLTQVERVVNVPRDAIDSRDERSFFSFCDESTGLISLNQVLELEQKLSPWSELPVVVVNDRGRRFGLVVERFMGERELVVRPLDPRLGKVRNVNAASIIQDGRPVLILDSDDLFRSIEKLTKGGTITQVGVETDNQNCAKSVLVVDDSLTVREVERKLLINRGYSVEVAVDGADGWNTIRSGQFDLIITDIDMPRMNGFDLVQRIKTHPDTSAIPVMVVSYKERDEDRQMAKQAGADFFLAKSAFHDDSLVNAVRDLIGESNG